MATYTGTSGDDHLTGTLYSDTYYTSGVEWHDSYYDPGGDDCYIIGPTGLTVINDVAGTDVAVLAGYDLADINIMTLFDSVVSLWTDDNAVCVWFESMVGGTSGGIDYLVLDDVTLNRAQLDTYAMNGFFGV